MDRQVLLLNASWEPICVIPLRRAVVLVMSEKAEVISPVEGHAVRSERLELPLPSVIRLIKYVNIPRFRKAYLSRRTVLIRDNHICAYCGKKATTMDHILPRSRGGAHSWENVVACCFSCNQEKDDRTPDEMHWKLRHNPYKPEGSKRLLLVIGSMDPSWEPFISMA